MSGSDIYERGNCEIVRKEKKREKMKAGGAGVMLTTLSAPVYVFIRLAQKGAIFARWLSADRDLVTSLRCFFLSLPAAIKQKLCCFPSALI